MIIQNEFIKTNNKRLLSEYKIQPRYISREEIVQTQTYKKPVLDGNAMVYFWMVYVSKGIKPKTEIYKLANLSMASGARAAKKCESYRFTEDIEFGGKKFPDITQKGQDFFGKIPDNKPYSKGTGNKHLFFQMMMEKHFKLFKPQIEKNWNSKFVDVSLLIGSQLIAIEIQLSKAHIVENAKRDYELAGADYVIFACDTKELAKIVFEIVSQLEEKYSKKTKVFTVSEILKKDPKDFLDSL